MAWWIFQNVVITTALAAAVAMVGRSGRIGPVAKHALWVLVLLKFITPPVVVWPWAAPDPLGLAAMKPAEDESPAPATAGIQISSADVRIAGSDAPSIAPETQVAEPAAAAAGLSGVSPWTWLVGIWAAGSLCLLGVEGARLARLARRIKSSRGPIPDPAIANRVTALSAQLGLRPVPVVVVRGATSPAVWGFGRPLLLWPASLPDDVTDACVDGLIVHELAHVKRGDHLVGWMELAAGVVWWWNPLFWFVRSSLREQAELACDAWVISALPNGRRAYAESLLTLSAATFSGVSPTSSTSMAVVGIRATNRRVLERRLVMIMRGRAPLRLPFVGLFCLAIVAMATLPAWATSQQTAPPPPVPVVSQKPAPPVVIAQTPSAPPTVVVQRTTSTPPTVVVQTTPPTPHTVDRRVSVPVARNLTRQAPPAPPTAVTSQRMVHVGQQGQQGQQGQAVLARFHGLQVTNLTEDGQKLIQGFEADREAIQKEVDQKIQARREAVIKELERLQDQYAKAGKLDEAVAIRDYLRAGGPPATVNVPFRRIAR